MPDSTQDEQGCTINIPPELASELVNIVGNSTRFESVEDFVVAVLGEFLSSGSDSSKGDDKEIRNRLGELGYLS